jgi:hypothetical protein
MSKDAHLASRLLAGVRIINGIAGLLAPRFLLRRLGDDGPGPQPGVYPFRMFGVRTVAIGLELLLLTGPERARASRVAVAIHATDTLSALTAGLRKDVPRTAALVTTLISAGNTVLAFLATREPNE